MKAEGKAKSERDQFFLFFHPSSFILHPCFSLLALLPFAVLLAASGQANKICDGCCGRADDRCGCADDANAATLPASALLTSAFRAATFGRARAARL
jgi:hypothetical protein